METEIEMKKKLNIATSLGTTKRWDSQLRLFNNNNSQV